MENKHINKMERLDASKLDVIAFKAINQKGYGDDIDRYIYSQSGEGLGSFFGNLVKKAIPILGKAIKGAAKGAAKAALPHLQDAAIAGSTNFLNSALDKVTPKQRGRGKRGIQEIVNINHTPHKRRRVNGL